jgi:DNA-directed RNA polymerase specialized sigma24 family protein
MTASPKWMLSQEAFDRLLHALDPDRERAGEKYQEIRGNLTRLFEWRSCPFPEDHADETINRVARRIEEGEEVRDVQKYFFGVARLVVLEIRKAQAREHRVLNSQPELRTTSDDSSQPDRRIDFLRHCLEGLLPDQREMVLAYYQGEKKTKINNRQGLSDRLHVTMNTLRMRVLRIRDQLEACVEECAKKSNGM